MLDSTGYPTETYWAVAEHYTIGQAFTERHAAFAEAAKKLARLLHQNETEGAMNVLRVYVDERQKDNDGDRPVKRFTLSLDEGVRA